MLPNPMSTYFVVKNFQFSNGHSRMYNHITEVVIPFKYFVPNHVKYELLWSKIFCPMYALTRESQSEEN